MGLSEMGALARPQPQLAQLPLPAASPRILEGACRPHPRSGLASSAPGMWRSSCACSDLAQAFPLGRPSPPDWTHPI